MDVRLNVRGVAGALWALYFIASYDFADLNLMKSGVLSMEKHTEVEQRAKQRQSEGSDIMKTSMNQGGRVGGSQSSCGCGGYSSPQRALAPWEPSQHCIQEQSVSDAAQQRQMQRHTTCGIPLLWKAQQGRGCQATANNLHLA